MTARPLRASRALSFAPGREVGPTKWAQRARQVARWALPHAVLTLQRCLNSNLISGPSVFSTLHETRATIMKTVAKANVVILATR